MNSRGPGTMMVIILVAAMIALVLLIGGCDHREDRVQIYQVNHTQGVDTVKATRYYDGNRYVTFYRGNRKTATYSRGKNHEYVSVRQIHDQPKPGYDVEVAMFYGGSNYDDLERGPNLDADPVVDPQVVEGCDSSNVPKRTTRAGRIYTDPIPHISQKSE